MEEKKSVLIVEDNTLTGEILQAVVESAGVSAWLCRDAASALALVHKQEFGVLIVDFRMPDLPGTEVVRAARCVFPSSYIIGVSIEHQRQQDFVEAGADAFLLKPFDIANLIALIDRNYPQREGA